LIQKNSHNDEEQSSPHELDDILKKTPRVFHRLVTTQAIEAERPNYLA